MEYEHAPSGRIISRLPAGKEEIIIAADHIRHTATGVHARIAILLGETLLVHSTFNVDRDEELVRLANSAHKMLSAQLAEDCPVNKLKHTLSTFCFNLWPEYIGGQLAAPSGSDIDDEGCTFALEPYVMDDAGTIAFAPPGAGKSYLMYTLAVYIDAGLNDLWHTCQRKVLVVNLERSQKSVERRIRQINRCLNLDPARRILALHRRGAKLTDVLPVIERSIEANGVQVVFLDSISRAGMGDLTQNEPVNAIMDALNGVCPTWFAIGHTPRNDATHVYGGVHFDAAADMTVQILTQHTEEALGVGLQVIKVNDIAKPPLYVLALEFDNRVGLISISKARPHQFPEIDAGKGASMGEEIEGLLMEIDKAAATDIARELGRNRSNVATVLRSDPRFVCVARDGKRVLYGLRTLDTE